MFEDCENDGSIQSRLDNFDKRHGGKCVRDGGFLYPDGASRERNPWGALNEPPSDPYERSRRIVQYHRVVFARASKTFQDARQTILNITGSNLQSASCGPVHEKEQIEAELKAKRTVALAAKKELDAAEANMQRLTPDWMRENQQSSLANRTKNEELRELAEKLEL